MTGVLTEKQKKELHAAVVEYLRGQGWEDAAAAVMAASGVGASDVPSDNLLEKKWTSILRLQKKTMTLEARVKELEASGGGGGGGAGRPGRGGGVRVPVAPERVSLPGHRGQVTSVAFHPQFTLLASASEDATVKLYDYESGEFDRTLKGHTQPVLAVAFAPGGQWLASASADLTVKLWDTASFGCAKTLHGHDHTVSSVAFHPSGDFVLSASRDKTVRVWEVATGFCKASLQGHEEWVRRVVCSADGALLASCSHDRTVRLWHFATGDCRHVLRGHEHVVECVAFAPPSVGSLTPQPAASAPARRTDAASVAAARSGRYVASGSRDKTIRVWDVENGECVMVLTGHDNWVRAVAFLPMPDAAPGAPAPAPLLVSVSDDKSIRVWDLMERRCVKTIADAHAHFVTCLDLCGRRPLLATGGVDNVVKVWNLD